MLKLFTLFHLNLMYSSLAEKDRPRVVARCYRPLLDLAEHGWPLALEAPGLTLELLEDLDPLWLGRLADLVQAGRITIVGSGYSQLIAPLVPATVNRRNLDLGRRVYRRLLGCEPDIWLVNEMAYGAGLPRLYREAGAKALVMEWNNAWKAHPGWDRGFAFHRQMVEGCEGTRLELIWVDTLDFQQLQRWARGEIGLEDFQEHWRGRRRLAGQGGFAALYGNDAEVFDFRPGRFRDEGTEDPRGEWDRLRTAAAALAADPGFALVPIGEVLGEPGSPVCGQPLRLESPDCPVVVKKQQKYNLNRWAVTGRGDLEANTACHRRAAALAAEGPDVPVWPGVPAVAGGDARGRMQQGQDEAWLRLCRLWSSDFRTHITAERWEAFRGELEQLAAQEPSPMRHETAGGGVLLAAVPGPHRDDTPGDGTPGNGTPGAEPRRLLLETPQARCTLDLGRGLAVRAASFYPWLDEPAVGTLAHGFFDDIALGADFYTGHAVLQRPGQPKRADLVSCGETLRRWRTAAGHLVAQAELADGELRVTKQVVVRADVPAIELRGLMTLPERQAGEIHPVHVTVVPPFLDPDRLGYSTRNGGEDPEIFALTGEGVHHGEAYSTLVTAKGGLGATDGRVVIGDRRRRLVLTHDPCVSALVPTVRHIPQPDGRYFLRLRYAAQEIDETFVPAPGPWRLEWLVRIGAEARGVEAP